MVLVLVLVLEGLVLVLEGLVLVLVLVLEGFGTRTGTRASITLKDEIG